ncbi:MAG: sulfide/dihydroorotate dehydrogenase-like FAD/NAD-binding protein [Firmicutes bacterium]|jgi:NAD(P)H-flavin reductase|nr:sulfide/dihydroorotate dehydrogenase-like FAD/NAD-binding protein [Bacillota bacterium]MDH7494962.1 sulfide/dihydroorotate dehydrogenase-like FAD/NAD-binding protein [Bacillota bacterium]
MHRIIKKEELAPRIKLFVVEAPEIASHARPGHFFVLRLHDRGERIPLTIADSDPGAGTITMVFQEVGKSTYELGTLEEGESILDLVGPLGTPREIRRLDTVVCVAGGVGVAPIYPEAKAFHELGTRVISLVGAQTKDMLIFKDRMEAVSDEVHYATDDGSFGYHGFVTGLLHDLLAGGLRPDEVVAIGPLPMMRAACKVTAEFGVKTVVSLNAIMVDGTGMCGSCRVTVDGKTMFSCVEGPAFDGHKVDFGELMARQTRFLTEEKLAMERYKAHVEGCKCRRE